MEFDSLAMAVLVAVPTFVCIASSLHLFSGPPTAEARSRLKAAAVLSCYAPMVVLAWLLLPENDIVSFGFFMILFFVGPILLLLALGFFLAARIAAFSDRKWDVLAISIATVIGVTTYNWAASGPAGW